MKEFINKLIGSFDNSTNSFSGRKLSAFASVITAIVFTFKFGTTEQVEVILTIWLGFGLLCLGIITMQQIVEFRSGNSSKTDNNEKVDNQ